MKRINRPLTILALVVLSVTVAILLWLFRRETRGLRETTTNVTLSFDTERLLRAPSDPAAQFQPLEALVESAKRNPYIRDLVVTKVVDRLPEGDNERPVVPYKLFAETRLAGETIRSRLDGMIRVPLAVDETPYGFLYFDLDRSGVYSVIWAILAATLALGLTLYMLLNRLYSQESTLVKVGIELDERKRELIRLERLALAGQLSANLLHDLKKPVLHIRHSMQDLREALGDFGGASVALHDTDEQIDLFFKMLKDSQMERFVRSDRVEEEYLDINDVLRFSLKLVHYERGNIEVEEHYAEKLPNVLAQPFRLIQVFSNLILNAYQAMNGQGKLTIASRHVEGDLVVRITDTGPGIPAENLARIFEPFFTTKAEADGSGLGLAICRLIVEDLTGSIRAESREGGPTSFIVRLPARGTIFF